MYQKLANYGFSFLDYPTPPVIGNFSIGIEKRNSAKYYWDNTTRRPSYLFQYTLGGSGTVEIDGVRHTVSAGQFFFLKFPGKEKYYFDVENNLAPWHFIYLVFEGSLIEDYYHFVHEKVGNIFSLPTNSPSIRALIEIFRLADTRQINHPYTAERLTFDFLCKLCTDCSQKKSVYSDTVQLAIQIMEKDFATLNGIIEVADRLHITQHHLSRLFTEQTGIKPIDFLTKQRLQYAIQQLTSSMLPIEEIALQSGFSSGNYFCKIFSRHFGISPLQYRKNTNMISYDRIQL